MKAIYTMKYLVRQLSYKKKLLRHFLKWRWFLIALVVGTMLNIINQYDAIFIAGDVHAGKLILTYIVPYCVSSLSAYNAQSD